MTNIYYEMINMTLLDKFRFCGDCMWRVYDPEGTCWEFCKGRYRPNAKWKRRPTVYHVNSISDAWRLLPLLQIDDTIVVDEMDEIFRIRK